MKTNSYRSIKLFRQAMIHLNKISRPGSLAFATVTFKRHITSPLDANKHYHSLAEFIQTRFSNNIKVIQPQESNRIHFHIVGSLKSGNNILIGYDHLTDDAVIEKASANSELRNESEVWKAALAHHPQFGEFCIKPVYDLAGLVEYLTKWMMEMARVEGLADSRPPLWKGIKLWVPSFPVDWKESVAGAVFEETLAGMIHAAGLRSLADFKKLKGKGWAFHVVLKKTAGYRAKKAAKHQRVDQRNRANYEKWLTTLNPDCLPFSARYKLVYDWPPYASVMSRK